MKISNFSINKSFSDKIQKGEKPVRKSRNIVFKQTVEITGSYLPELLARLMAALKRPSNVREFKQLTYDNLNAFMDMEKQNPKLLEALLTRYSSIINSSDYGKFLLKGNMSIELENISSDLLLNDGKITFIFPGAGVKAKKSAWLN